MIADYCSRHPINGQSSESIAESHVLFIAHSSLPNVIMMKHVMQATQIDCVLQCVINTLQNNSWFNQPCGDKDSFCHDKQLAEDLSVVSVSEGRVLL